MRLPGRGTLLFIIPVLCLVHPLLFGQRELVPSTDPVYQFLFRQELRGTIHGFQWGMLPLSRREVSSFLDSLDRLEGLPETDQRMLQDFDIRFSYDRSRTLELSSSFLPAFTFAGIADDRRQKYLYMNVDSTSAFFLDGFASYSYRAGKGDSVGSAFAALGEIGFRIRGTLFDRLGFFLQASNGRQFSGSHDFAIIDPRLKANKKFNSDERAYFDFTNGYMRYDADWLALTVGREQLAWGTGFSDRMMFSGNTVPFDFVKLDIRSGNLRYSFLHGSLVGSDTTGHTASSKYIAAHRLEFNIGSRFRLGLGEAILYSNQPPTFALLNPMAFLTSTELSTEGSEDNAHNSIIWIDASVNPARNVRVSGAWLIDDISFGSLGKSDVSGNTNKFGWQAGILWNDALRLDNLILSLEYTRIGPFVETHRTIFNSFTHWNLPLGDALQPNSDEWTVEAGYDVTSRLSIRGKLQFQRTGENIVDQSGGMVFNAGSDFLRGDGDITHPNVFLEGNRVNRTLGTFELTWQPIRQYFIELQYFTRSFRYLAEGRNLSDSILWATLRVDY